MNTIGTIAVPTDIIRSAGVSGALYLSARLDAFLRNPGPGDAAYYDAVILPDGKVETVGCVGESYDDRLYDSVWMLRMRLRRLGGIRTRKLVYWLSINGEPTMLAAIAEETGITIMLPDDDVRSTAA